MVKFSKQFEGQLVPEWKDAFVDYWQLKKDLKKIQNNTHPEKKPLQRSASLVQTVLSAFYNRSHKLKHKDHHGLIQVHKNLASSVSKGDFYVTELLGHLDEGSSDVANEFFARLDNQLNKVNMFYRNKEMEFLERGGSLMKQLEILMELKTVLKKQRADGSSSLRVVEEELEEDNEDEEDVISAECGKFERSVSTNKLKRSLSTNGRIISFQGKNVKLNIPLTTPSRTISELTYIVWEDMVNQSRKGGADGGSNSNSNRVNVNKAKLHRAEKMIRGACVELYKGLDYLSTYRNLNMMAFGKILKKFDKITGKQVLPIYLKVAESSYFNSSDKAIKLSDEIEKLFIKNFADDDRNKAMKYLRPHQRKESHAVTFFIGLFAGGFVALFAGYCIMAHLTGMYSGASDSVYMETVYPILSMFSLLFFHLFLYGCNIFLWRKTRINYSFIFEFSVTKELKYRDVFLICTTSMTVVVGVLFAHLSLIARSHREGNHTSTAIQAIPGILLMFFLGLLVCPFNILYLQTRYRFLKVIRNIILTPLYKVVMVDFFMADQLCSQVPLLRNLEYVACYYITGSYKTQDYGFCNRTTHYRELAYAVSFLPYYWRAMQCARRWFDEGQTSHLVNLGKYVSAMLAAGAKVGYEKEKTAGWLALLIVISSMATVYQLYWDFVKDWGLLQFNSKNRWLRNELVLKRKFIYFLSMGLNFVLRLAWLQSVLHSSFGNLNYRVVTFFLAALEVIRRGQWNFYRLENEHLNNAGKFRAVKTVPLPFHEVDQV